MTTEEEERVQRANQHMAEIEDAGVRHHIHHYAKDKFKWEWTTLDHVGLWAWGGEYEDVPPKLERIEVACPSHDGVKAWRCYIGPLPEFETPEAKPEVKSDPRVNKTYPTEFVAWASNYKAEMEPLWRAAVDGDDFDWEKRDYDYLWDMYNFLVKGREELLDAAPQLAKTVGQLWQLLTITVGLLESLAEMCSQQSDDPKVKELWEEVKTMQQMLQDLQTKAGFVDDNNP